MNRNSSEYLIEYTDLDGNVWTHAEKTNVGEALEMIEECRANTPQYKWHVTKKSITYKRLLVTRKGREVEV